MEPPLTALAAAPGPQPPNTRARHLRPDLKVLLTSGYTAAALSLEHGLPDNLEIVGKPYQREELAKTLRLVIAAES